MIKLVSDALAKKENGEKGFTLIELLVVVIILGILAAIAIPVFLSIREGAWKSSVETDVRNAVIAVEQASVDNNGAVSDLPAVTVANDGARTYTFGTQPGTLSDGVGIVITPAGDNTYTIAGNHAEVDGQTYTYSSTLGSGSWSTSGGGSGD